MNKKYNAVKERITKPVYSLDEALDLLGQTSITKFDPTVETHFKLNVDLSKPEQTVRGITTLPHGTGKKITVAALVSKDHEKEAKESKADIIGGEELITKIGTGFTDFDIVIASPDMMSKLGKVAKILGQKGLMPNPKSGTITTDIGKVISQIKAGRIEFRMDKNGNVHQAIGKLSWGREKIKENFINFYHSLIGNRPAGIKGSFIGTTSINVTMGPAIKIDTKSIE